MRAKLGSLLLAFSVSLAAQLPALAQGPGGDSVFDLGGSASGPTSQAVGDRTISGAPQLIDNPDLLTLNLANADVRQVLGILADKGGMNLMLDDSVQGTISLSLKAVPLNEALDLVLQMRGLEAKRVGSTLLIASRQVFQEKFEGAMQTVLLRIDNSDVKDIEPKIEQALENKTNEKNIKIISDERTNSLLITAPQDIIDKAKALIQALDIPTPQVLIDVKMVEVTKQGQEQMGMHYGFGGAKFGASYDNPNPDTLAGGAGNQAGNPATGTAGTTISFNALGNFTANFNAQLDWAIQHNYATVLADPEVAAQDNMTASIDIVDKHPVITTAKDSVGMAYSQVGFVDVGQSLTLTPRIDTKGFVTLKLHPTISADSGDVIVNGNPVPVINSRSVTTTMRVRDGEPIVIGGLTRRDTTTSVEKLPILGDIPILGKLFQTTTESNDDSEIIIVVTPHITTQLASSEELLPGLETGH